MQQKFSQLPNRLAVCVCALGLAILLLHAFLGYYSFPQVDDWDNAFWTNTKGYIGTLVFAYQTFSGRFSCLLTLSLVNGSFLFPFHANLFIVASIALFFISFALFLHKALGNTAKIFVLADIAFFMLVLPIDIKEEAFYVDTFNILYVVPASLAFLGLYFIFGTQGRDVKKERYLWAGLIAYFTFVAGYNELQPLVMIGGIGIYLATNTDMRRELFYGRMCAVLIGNIIGLLINIAAPGNYARLGGHTDMLHITLVTMQTYKAMFLPFLAEITVYAFMRAYFVATPTVKYCKTNGRFMLYVLTVLAISFMLFFLVIYGYRARWAISPRTILLPSILCFISMLFFVSWLAARYPLSRFIGVKFSNILLLTLFAFMTYVSLTPAIARGINDLWYSYQNAPEQRKISVVQMEQTIAAKAEGKDTVVVAKIPAYKTMVYHFPLGPRPNSWENGPFKRYFGMKEVTTEP
jgi:hypothetical protein